MERVIMWHMEVDLKIHSTLNKKQFGFTRGASTETALHKIIHRIERTILNSGMALGTFLDIEGAFDNVSFSAIDKALDKKCPSIKVKRWIMAMIKSRSLTMEINGTSKTIRILKGCPQGGILSPFLWNLVVDSLLNYTKDQIPCEMQGFADDIALIATLESSRPCGHGGFDADTLREMTQKSLNSISNWCKESGLTISALKTHSVMFTWKRKWNFTNPLKVDSNDIEMRTSTKFLGVHLDSKLSWNVHIEALCKKAKGILMQCRKTVGPTWGFTPHTIKWIYNAIVRPSLSYGAVVWINGLNNKNNVKLLRRVQRLANILITGALPSTPGDAMDKINGMIPIENLIEEEALKGALRLKANGHLIQVPMVNKNGILTSHTKVVESILNSIPLKADEQDQITQMLNLDTGFSVEIPERLEYKEVSWEDMDINCFTDGSRLENCKTGAGVLIEINQNATVEESIHLGLEATVFQAEVFAVGRAASHLLQSGVEGKNVVINCDSQAALQALECITTKSSTTLETVQNLNTLATNNQVRVRWIPAHQGFVGNEKADDLAKRGANEIGSTNIKLPVPRATWNMAVRKRTNVMIERKWREVPPSHFTRVWRDKFAGSLPHLSRSNLRKMTMFLTGHSTLNYTLNKYKPNTISKTCPHCEAEEETLNHFIGRCPKWSAQRSALFNSFYISITDVVEQFPLSVILNFINATGRLKATTQWTEDNQGNNHHQ